MGTKNGVTVPPWWTFLILIPIVGWLLLPIAGVLSDWHGITGRLAYRRKHGKWEQPAEGRITFINKDQQAVAAEDAIGYIRDGKIIWYLGGLSIREMEQKINNPIWLPKEI